MLHGQNIKVVGAPKEYFRRGNYVKIVKYNDSVYNLYKGYVGEIRECYENYAIVNIEAESTNKNISIPLEHLIRFYHNKYC